MKSVRTIVSLTFQVRALYSPRFPLRYTHSINHSVTLCLYSAAAKTPMSVAEDKLSWLSKVLAERALLPIARIPIQICKTKVKINTEKDHGGTFWPPTPAAWVPINVEWIEYLKRENEQTSSIIQRLESNLRYKHVQVLLSVRGMLKKTNGCNISWFNLQCTLCDIFPCFDINGHTHTPHESNLFH